MNTAQSANILEVRSICKSFVNVEAVRNITFSIKQGDIFAFLGPNGAGKTMMIALYGFIVMFISDGYRASPVHIRDNKRSCTALHEGMWLCCAANSCR